jgi:hypothetical protein
MSLRAIARQSRRMHNVHALATRLPRRFTPRNDIYNILFTISPNQIPSLFLYQLQVHLWPAKPA